MASDRYSLDLDAVKDQPKSRTSSLLKKQKTTVKSPTKFHTPAKLESSVLSQMATSFFDRVKTTGK